MYIYIIIYLPSCPAQKNAVWEQPSAASPRDLTGVRPPSWRYNLLYLRDTIYCISIGAPTQQNHENLKKQKVFDRFLMKISILPSPEPQVPLRGSAPLGELKP